MATRSVLATAGCAHCRTSVLRLFIAPPLAAVPSSLSRAPIAWRSTSISQISRRYISNSSLRQAADIGTTRPTSLDEDNHENTSADALPAQASSDEVPWYLQVEPPRHVPSAEPPPLPQAPEDSPPVISTLLEYASEEMGLDDLSLLDLRQLDPAPALGSNLFMLFGTARSERHLNVSAGRLVRWLRAKHHIHADADGLLGPNERKTRLRRKAKRAKLLGTMGTDDADDGITTGWICVNLGTINRSTAEATVLGSDGRVAGFGVPQTGSTIVVQIMTESRREELGLEALWEGALARQAEELLQSDGKTPSDTRSTEKTTLSS
ncbi:hypothetical protein BX600DRAFT_446790 [Xylariales sp. PMI_506]|nr:hypothetical protein BX600DRAFT_446790 [Xylariales sp. PMI_506]